MEKQFNTRQEAPKDLKSMHRAGDYRGPGVEKRIPKKEHYDMDIRSYSANWKYYPEFHCYYLRDVVYCATPKEPNLECMNLFIPKEYINADGSLNPGAACGNYITETAPILVHSAVMGYSEAPAAMLSLEKGSPDQELTTSFLAKGMIYVSVAARGRQTQDENGTYIGKAPALVTDVKAALRFYRHNKAFLPGNTDRMVIFGVSAGGNLASLIGSTCDCKEYDPGLKEIGACMEESDAVFAAQAFCPITDLAHADLAYEWMYKGHWHRDLPPFMAEHTTCDLTDFQKALSDEMGKRYVSYANQFAVKDPLSDTVLSLNEDGRSGSLYDALIRDLETAATKYIRYLLGHNPKAVSCTLEDYLAGNYTIIRKGPGGTREVPGIDKRSWLSWDGEKAHISDLDSMLSGCTRRMKNCPAFDSLDLEEFENEELGHPDQKLSHFNFDLFDILNDLKEAYPEEYRKYAPAFESVRDDELLQQQSRLINPHNFIHPGAANLCPHFRIRVGNMDPHTSFTTAMLMAYRLREAGVDVDFAFQWEANHGVCDYEGEFLEWVESIQG